jgi:hypothetical protein
MLVRCLYVSQATSKIETELLDSILDQSRKNNVPRGITGMLCVAGNSFIQVIEGGRDQVCELLKLIFRDDRHRDVRILTYEEIRERRFQSWTMGQVNLGGVNPSLLLKYSELAVLNPLSCSGATTMALLDELLANGAVSGRGI